MSALRTQHIVAEAARLRRLGYSWQRSFDAAEMMQLLIEAGATVTMMEDLVPKPTGEKQ